MLFRSMGKEGKKLCTKISEKLRFAMGRYVAPKISDFVFYKANGKETTLDLTSADLVYVSAESVVRELEVEGEAL